MALVLFDTTTGKVQATWAAKAACPATAAPAGSAYALVDGEVEGKRIDPTKVRGGDSVSAVDIADKCPSVERLEVVVGASRVKVGEAISYTIRLVREGKVMPRGITVIRSVRQACGDVAVDYVAEAHEREEVTLVDGELRESQFRCVAELPRNAPYPIEISVRPTDSDPTLLGAMATIYIDEGLKP